MAQLQYSQWPTGSTAIQCLAMKELLTTVPAYEVTNIAFDKRTLNRQMGAAIVLRRWLTPSVDATPAPEGTQKEARNLVPNDYTGTMLRYTERIQVSRYDYDLHPWDAVKGGTQRMRELVVSTRERVRANSMVGGPNRIYNSAAVTARNQVNGAISPGRLQTVVRSLERAKAMLMTDVIGGQNKEGTAPVEGAYYAFTHSDLQPDLRALPGFQVVAQYPSGMTKNFREFGAFQNIRFFTTPEFPYYPGAGAATATMLATGGNTDVYPIVVCGQEAFTSVKLNGDGREGFGNLDVKVLDQPDKYDPNNNWVDIVSSWYDLAMPTAYEWSWIIEVGATANL